MAVTYNLKHTQVAQLGGVPTWVDVPGAVSFAPTVDTPSTPIRGDGIVYVTAYGAPEGTFDMTWLETNLAVLGVINDGTISTSGSDGTLIDKYIQTATYVAPEFAVATWEPNIRDTSVHAGLRTTIPSATSGIATKASGQETTGEWTASGSFKGGGADTLFVYELMATEPTYTSGVFTVTLPS